MNINDDIPLLIRRHAIIGSKDDCWPYNGKTFALSGNGTCKYGQIRVNGKTCRAHRAAYTEAFGPILAGMFVCHACDNSLCINPHHLFLGTAADNNKDKMAKCRHRAARGEKSGMAKLSDKDAIEVACAARNGQRQRVLAEKYGISASLVSMLKNGRTRQWLVG